MSFPFSLGSLAISKHKREDSSINTNSDYKEVCKFKKAKAKQATMPAAQFKAKHKHDSTKDNSTSTRPSNFKEVYRSKRAKARQTIKLTVIAKHKYNRKDSDTKDDSYKHIKESKAKDNNKTKNYIYISPFGRIAKEQEPKSKGSKSKGSSFIISYSDIDKLKKPSNIKIIAI